MPLWPAWVLLAGAAACGVPAMTTSPTDAQRYEARGQEPGWHLVIDGGRIDNSGDYGEVRIAASLPQPRATANGRRFETPRLTVDIVHGRCNDSMSGHGYEDRVTVVADGRRFEGCGGVRRTDWDV